MSNSEFRAIHKSRRLRSPVFEELHDVVEWLTEVEDIDDWMMQDRHVGPWEELT